MFLPSGCLYRCIHLPLNTYISLHGSVVRNRDGEEEELVNMISDAAGQSPEDMVIDRENVIQLEQTIERELSNFEKQVLDLYLTGMGYQQIAKVLGRDDKSTDNALQRIKTKLRKRIEGGGKGNPSHRETDESNAVARREDVSTIEMEVVRVRSIRISSS